uniref:hypothetical protein n=1 Tax=Singulisphaera acidiphila TaxID=466153 RepID=UPI0002470E5F|nr:hypothetical protein [Singulisphaera acidiphila]
MKLTNAKGVAAETILTVLFAAAARISSLSDTCRVLRGVPDEHALATALYATLPDYDRLRRRVQAALQGHLPKALRRRAQVIANDTTLLPYYGADARTNPHVVRSKAKKGTCSFFGYSTAYVIRKGRRYTIALTAVTRDMTMADVVRELLTQVRAAGVKVRYTALDREFSSVEVIRYLQQARVPFLMPVVGRGCKADHPRGPSGTNVFKVTTGSAARGHARVSPFAEPGDPLMATSKPNDPLETVAPTGLAKAAIPRASVPANRKGLTACATTGLGKGSRSLSSGPAFADLAG